MVAELLVQLGQSPWMSSPKQSDDEKDGDQLAMKLIRLLELPDRLVKMEAELRTLRSTIEMMQEALPPVVVTIPEAAKRLGVSVSTVRRQVKSGALPVINIGSSVRIDLTKLRPVDEAKVVELAMAARRDHDQP